MTAEEYEAAFHGIDLPETLQLDSGVFVPDTSEFIAKSIDILKSRSAGARVEEAVKYRLDRALEIITSQNAQ
ncbi:DUF6965 family protein [Pedobacter faecalis]|uniref:DUF6965 family protein n=1 Tax=Pedobacter faecalis TaxID=3041495 RepID=UPI002549F9B1|nr:hypothetical protein [Pedobacter sp. ELA7]